MPHAQEIQSLKRRHFGHRRDIGAGDEGAIARAGQDQHTHLGIAPHLVEGVRNIFEHDPVERIERGGAVHGQGRDGSLFECHFTQFQLASLLLASAPLQALRG